MDFEEFLWANGDNMMMDFIRNQFTNKQPLGQALHRKVMDYFRLYLIVGGMPQAVQKYIDTHSFEDTDRVKGKYSPYTATVFTTMQATMQRR